MGYSLNANPESNGVLLPPVVVHDPTIEQCPTAWAKRENCVFVTCTCGLKGTRYIARPDDEDGLSRDQIWEKALDDKELHLEQMARDHVPMVEHSEPEDGTEFFQASCKCGHVWPHHAVIYEEPSKGDAERQKASAAARREAAEHIKQVGYEPIDPIWVSS